MTGFTKDSISQTIAFIAVSFGLAALVLTCVGLGTPRWYSAYVAIVDANSIKTGNYAKTDSVNFFYACEIYQNGTVNNCISRSTTLYHYPGYNTSNPWMTDYNQRMQNAGALCIVGIIFLFLGTLTTLIMAIIYFRMASISFIPPALLFLACLFMLAGMAEGSRYLLYNDYSANLYQTGHLLTIFTLFLSAFAAGRIHFIRWSEADKDALGS